MQPDPDDEWPDPYDRARDLADWYAQFPEEEEP